MGAQLKFLHYIAQRVVQLLVFLFFFLNNIPHPDLKFVAIGDFYELLNFFAQRNRLVTYTRKLDVAEPFAFCTKQISIPLI